MGFNSGFKGLMCTVFTKEPLQIMYDFTKSTLQRHFITSTLIDLQLDAQNSYLIIYNTFIKILYMSRTLPCSSSGGVRRNCIYAASGIVTLCR